MDGSGIADRGVIERIKCRDGEVKGVVRGRGGGCCYREMTRRRRANVNRIGRSGN